MTELKGYPKGKERIEFLREQNRVLGELQSEAYKFLIRQEEQHGSLERYCRAAAVLAQLSRVPWTPIDYATHAMSLYSKEPIIPPSLQMIEDVAQLEKIATFGAIHDHDFRFMIADWMLEQLERNQSPDINTLHLELDRIASYLILRIVYESETTLTSLGRLRKGDELVPKDLVAILKESREYWLENIRDRPAGQYPVLEQTPILLPPSVIDAIQDSRGYNLTSFIAPGGTEYRETIATLACEGMTSALDAGAGEGFLAASLVYRVKEARAIDLKLFETSKRLMQALHQQGKAIEIEVCPLNQYQSQVDAVVLSEAPAFTPVEEICRQIARVARHRAVLGIVTATDHLTHYAAKDEVITSGFYQYSICSTEPLRWARELGKYFRNVEVSLYDNRTFVVKAEGKK